MKEYVPLRKPGRPRRGGNGIKNKDGDGTSKQKAVKLTVKRKKNTKKAGEGSSNQEGQGGVETANDATIQEENATVHETAQEENATGEETVQETMQEENGTKCGYEPHKIAQAIERGLDANKIEDHLEADLEEDVNEIEDNLLEENLEMGVDANEIVPPVQGEVAIQGLDANAWVGEDDQEIDGNIDFIEDTQVVGRPRKRKIFERIVKIKLKKAVYDKDGMGFSIKKLVNLE
ncbi:unnamed protein product [Lactuca saligna]|uniref:Uncharacterized protein n=1 Tax=Lactuca saligna TaxID=75948 RepID=A0AA35ZXD7_LACSI|nr:unnamed protein product [Lactuca saligna]